MKFKDYLISAGLNKEIDIDKGANLIFPVVAEMLNDLAKKIESLEEKHKCEHGKWKGECERTHISYS